MLKKILYLIIPIFLLGFSYIAYQFYWKETRNLNTLYLIPKDAVYFIQSDDPIGNWEEIRESDIWKHLRTNAYFAELTSSANTLDTLLKDNKRLFQMLGAKKLWVSAHVISQRKFDHLYLIDLGKTSRFADFKVLLKKIISSNFRLTERSYDGIEIMELYDEKSRETLYMSIIDNNLVVSYTGLLVEASILQRKEPYIGRDLHFIEINKEVNRKGLLRFYTQYDYIDEFAKVFDFNDNEWLQSISKSLYFSGIDIDMKKGQEIIAEGFTNINETDISYLLSLQKAGEGSHSIEKIAPLRTGAYLSFGFDSYTKFYENYLELQKQNPASYKNFQDNKKQIENLLKIDLKENFIDWIDDEVALLKFETETFGTQNDFALIIKAKNGNDARKNLNFIADQVRKRTPLKFKEVAYRGQIITFMSVKGFFKFFFGGFFNKLENPYYTIIDDYVIFTNHPNTLKYVINNYLDETTLDTSENYQTFSKHFKNKSNVYCYINTPMYYESFTSNFSGTTKSDLNKNKAYLTGFTQIGFQLFPKDELFQNILVVQYQTDETIQTQDEFSSWDVLIDEITDTEEVIPEADKKETIDIPEINPDDFNAKVFKMKYPTGELWYEVDLKDGKKHGSFRAYYLNGETLIKGRFKNDKPIGNWKKYDSIGNLVFKKKM